GYNGQTTASYNAAGLLIKETRITDGGAWKETKKYGYDSKGRRTSTIFSTNGKTRGLIEEGHDLNGGRFFQVVSKGLKQPENKGGKKPRSRRSLNQRKPI